MENKSTILRQAQHTTTAWADGAGSTQAVVRHPLEGPCDWQIGFQQVKEATPLDTPIGCDRWIVLVEGASLALAAADGSQRVLEAQTPLHICGDDAITATPDGRVRDLVLDTRREVCTGEMTIHRLGTPLELEPVEGSEVWVAVIAGWLKVERDLLGPVDVFGVTGPLTLSGDSNAVVAVMSITGLDGESQPAA